MKLFNFLFRKKKAFVPYVKWDDYTITYHQSDILIESLAWDNLETITIETTDQGPFSEDLFWILIGDNQQPIRIPSSIKGLTKDNGLLQRLQQLPGFNNQAVIDASCCTKNKQFLCWSKKTHTLQLALTPIEATMVGYIQQERFDKAPTLDFYIHITLNEAAYKDATWPCNIILSFSLLDKCRWQDISDDNILLDHPTFYFISNHNECKSTTISLTYQEDNIFHLNIQTEPILTKVLDPDTAFDQRLFIECVVYFQEVRLPRNNIFPKPENANDALSIINKLINIDRFDNVLFENDVFHFTINSKYTHFSKQEIDIQYLKDALRYEALKLSFNFGELNIIRVKELIDSLMSTGIYCDAFLDIIDATYQTPREKYTPAIIASLQQLGIVIPTEIDKAIQIILYNDISNIAYKRIAPILGLEQLIDKVYWNDHFRSKPNKSLGESYGIATLIYLYECYDDIHYDIPYMPKERIREMQQDIINAANDWMNLHYKHTMPPPQGNP